MNDALQPRLRQRGRASVDFLAHLFFGSRGARQDIQEHLNANFGEGASLPDDLDERHEAITQALSRKPGYRAGQTIGEWHARQHGLIAVEAFEALKPDITERLARYDQGPSRLIADENFKAPEYFDGVEIHRTRGGWDGHPYMGFVHGEIVHRLIVEATYPGGIFKQRRLVAGLAPKNSYNRILEMGCSTGHFTQALAETYPDAEITGVDVSIRALEHALRTGNACGHRWQLHLRAAEDTGFDDGRFDLAASYILLHEMPADAIRAAFAEAYRVLEPGGDLLMSDVARYAHLNKVQEWQADQTARFGGEPFWRESASLDLAAILEEAGFEEVDGRAIGNQGYPYPYVVTARKPE
ncbi:MAG: class I SAM-dependent methyltransferase [Gammaproteobacteria bacterium]|nr:class I SAM-dependent methyltransferase [Gammaproteobacteria bacterium]MCY4341400.1 class I SAM-dependent methyltransferase [Gammaproteobacteria bacterium]